MRPSAGRVFAGCELQSHAGAVLRGLIERQPHNAARTVIAVAVSWLAESVGQLPFLRFIAPLGYGLRDDIL
jgi:hypothetical protein